MSQNKKISLTVPLTIPCRALVKGQLMWQTASDGATLPLGIATTCQYPTSSAQKQGETLPAQQSETTHRSGSSLLVSSFYFVFRVSTPQTG